MGRGEGADRRQTNKSDMHIIMIEMSSHRQTGVTDGRETDRQKGKEGARDRERSREGTERTKSK